MAVNKKNSKINKGKNIKNKTIDDLTLSDSVIDRADSLFDNIDDPENLLEKEGGLLGISEDDDDPSPMKGSAKNKPLKNIKSFHNSSEQYLIGNANKYKLLTREEEIQLFKSMEDLNNKILGKLLIYPDFYHLIIKIKNNILQKKYTIKTLIDLNLFTNKKIVLDNNELLVEEILSRCDKFLNAHQKFMQATQMNRYSKKLVDINNVYKMSDPVLTLFTNIHLQKKYIKSVMKKYKDKYKRCLEIEKQFNISRLHKKKKNKNLVIEYQELLNDADCSFHFLDNSMKILLSHHKANIKLERKITNSNLRLVYATTRLLSKKSQSHLFVDFIQAGILGLKHAIHKYNLNYNCKVTTHAFLWVLQSQKRAQHQSTRVMSLPVHIAEQICRIYRAETTLADKLGYTPSIEQVSEYCKIPVEKICKIKLCTNHTVQYSKVITDGNTTLEDAITDNDSPEKAIAEDNLITCQKISDLSLNLSPRNEYLLRNKIALDNMGSHNSEKVMQKKKILSEQLDLNADRLRQTTSRSANNVKTIFNNYYNYESYYNIPNNNQYKESWKKKNFKKPDFSKFLMRNKQKAKKIIFDTNKPLTNKKIHPTHSIESAPIIKAY